MLLQQLSLSISAACVDPKTSTALKYVAPNKYYSDLIAAVSYHHQSGVINMVLITQVKNKGVITKRWVKLLLEINIIIAINVELCRSAGY